MRTALTKRAIEYAWRELARRAGFALNGDGDSAIGGLGVRFHYGQPSEVSGDVPTVVVVPSEPGDWQRLLDLPERRLETMPLRDVLPIGASHAENRPLPVLFRGRGTRSTSDFARLDGHVLIFECDLLASTLFLLSRWEESVHTARDKHDRIPFTESVAHRQGFLDRPLVDDYALVLREWLKVLRPAWLPTVGRFKVQLSHDIDVIAPFGRLGRAAKTLAGDLVRRKDPARAAAGARLALMQGIAPRRTVDYEGIFRLAEISRRHDMASAFFFMAAEPGPYDSAYDPSSRPVREAIRKLEDLGFEIGLHAGYSTFGNPDRLAEEKSRLDAILGRSVYGGRQHYLRFLVPDTWRQWERLGLSYDSTMTFAGHEGFRCGTCHSYRPFDLEADRVLHVEEQPLIVMDGTLRQYRGLTASEAEIRVLELARRCRDAEGTFTLLWHNSSLAGEWAEWGLDYEGLIAKLSALEKRSNLPIPFVPEAPRHRSVWR